MENDLTATLDKFIQDNPGMPVIPWLGNDVILDKVAARIGRVIVGDLACIETFGLARRVEGEDPEELIIQYLCSEGAAEDEAKTRAKDLIDNAKWERRIFIDLIPWQEEYSGIER